MRTDFTGVAVTVEDVISAGGAVRSSFQETWNWPPEGVTLTAVGAAGANTSRSA
jgi:orotate phosphoribosyltransferase